MGKNSNELPEHGLKRIMDRFLKLYRRGNTKEGFSSPHSLPQLSQIITKLLLNFKCIVFILQIDNSPAGTSSSGAPFSPIDGTGASNSASSGNQASGALNHQFMGMERVQPLSDNNISTTNDCLTFCDLDEPEDLNVSLVRCFH